MKVTSQGKLARIVLYILLVLFAISLLFLPLWLKFLTIPEQVFILTLLVFFIIYSKLFGGLYFVSTLLSMIDKWEDVYNHLASKLSNETLYKYLVEGDLLLLTETQLLKVKEIGSLVFDVTLVFLLGLGIVYVGGIIDPNVVYAALLAVAIVWILEIFIELYVDLKFARVFEQEIKELAQAFAAINLENQIAQAQENEESNKETNTDMEEKALKEKDVENK